MEKERFHKAKLIIEQMEALSSIIDACKDERRDTLTLSKGKLILVRGILAKFGEDELDKMMAEFKKI